MDIEELIRYHQENDYLDFKLEEYKREDKAELIRDVLAFANARVSHDRYIIIGMKKKGEEVQYNPIAEPRDAAGIQQTIHENIVPELKISYESFIYKGHQLQVLTIHHPADQPYAAAKDLPGLRKNEMHIRKGTFKMLISRADLDRIYTEKLRTVTLDDKIQLTFSDGSKTLDVPCATNIDPPTKRNRHEIEKQIRWKEELIGTDPKEYTRRFGHHRGLQSNYSEMDLPDLRVRLSSVDMNFQEEDVHYLQETRAYKLNFLLHNQGEQHLDNPMVALSFPDLPSLVVVHRIAPNTYQRSVVSGHDYNAGYPSVSKEKDDTVVSSEPGDVRHHLPIEIFRQPLRLFIPEELKGKKLTITATIYGRNLRQPQNQELELTFI